MISHTLSVHEGSYSQLFGLNIIRVVVVLLIFIIVKMIIVSICFKERLFLRVLYS